MDGPPVDEEKIGDRAFCHSAHTHTHTHTHTHHTPTHSTHTHTRKPLWQRGPIFAHPRRCRAQVAFAFGLPGPTPRLRLMPERPLASAASTVSCVMSSLSGALDKPSGVRRALALGFFQGCTSGGGGFMVSWLRLKTFHLSCKRKPTGKPPKILWVTRFQRTRPLKPKHSTPSQTTHSVLKLLAGDGEWLGLIRMGFPKKFPHSLVKRARAKK